MRPAKKRRLLTLLSVLVGVSCAVGLLLVGLGSNINHYYELSAIESGEAPIGTPIRIGGMVQKGSLERTPGSLKIRFVVTDFTRTLNISYDGIVPDLFREGQGVLVKGILSDAHTFSATEILAKHDENYMPKEVRAELEKSGYYQHATQNKSVRDARSNNDSPQE